MSEIWRSGLTLLINLHSCAKYDVPRSFCSEIIENNIKFQYFYLHDNGQGQEYLTHIWQLNLCCLCAYVCNFFSDRLKRLKSNCKSKIFYDLLFNTRNFDLENEGQRHRRYVSHSAVWRSLLICSPNIECVSIFVCKRLYILFDCSRLTLKIIVKIKNRPPYIRHFNLYCIGACACQKLFR